MLAVVSGRSIGVPPLSYERLSDLRRVRMEVELLAAVWGTPNIGNAEIERLQEFVTAMEEAVRSGDNNNTRAGTVRFTSGSTRLRNPMRCSRSSRRYGCRSVLISTSSTHPAITSTNEQHELMLAALRARDGVAVGLALRDDIDAAYSVLASLLGTGIAQ